MRLKGRQLRFVLAVALTWAGGRIVAVRWGSLPEAASRLVETPAIAAKSPHVAARTLVEPAAVAQATPPRPTKPARHPAYVSPDPVRIQALAMLDAKPSAWQAMTASGTDAPATSSVAGGMPPTGNESRWSATGYLFWRPGSGRPSLAGGGALGESQAAARLAYRLTDGPVRTALAARLYSPLHGKGAEVAAGIDVQPHRRVPVRLSVERRVGLDHAGRDAWSAYAAGGFYAEPVAGALVVDGYAQAGAVGIKARDLFVDGALRAGRRIAAGDMTILIGAGAWGAAQPGVERIDAGPRLAISVPAGAHRLSIAAEGRLRVAGQARPGSGAALTVGVDF